MEFLEELLGLLIVVSLGICLIVFIQLDSPIHIKKKLKNIVKYVGKKYKLKKLNIVLIVGIRYREELKDLQEKN